MHKNMLYYTYVAKGKNMQNVISYTLMQKSLVVLNSAFKKRNLHINLFLKRRNYVLQYVNNTPNWETQVTKQYAKVITMCIMLNEDYYGVCEEFNLRIA